jgi:catechol 2,3-dioxygenase-like lactoylglutathione lyase family enzyme
MSGCGCPPTAEPGRVHHVFLNVRDFARSRAFYALLMPRLGYGEMVEDSQVCGFLSPGGSVWIKQAGAAFAEDTFHKDRVGLAEVAFAAASREQVDALHADLVAHGVAILDPPREYPEYVPGYYAVFFADPDGIKLEFVHIPV